MTDSGFAPFMCLENWAPAGHLSGFYRTFFKNAAEYVYHVVWPKWENQSTGERNESAQDGEHTEKLKHSNP